jgi:hypothetical protein
MDRDRWLKLEFAVLTVLVLLAMVQLAGYLWRTLAALF